MAFDSLRDKRVLITGAGSGIGYEIALAFARAGCRIIATDIQQQALEALQQQLESQGADCTIHLLDVTDQAAWTALAEKLATATQVPDILVNNAGIAYMAGILETSPEMLDRTLAINIKGVVYGCQAFIPLMKDSDTPKQIVNIASTASKTPAPNMSAYAASKFAVEGLSDVIAMELHYTKIKVLCVHPGVIDTAIVKNRNMIGVTFSDEQISKLQHYFTSKGCHPSVVAADIVGAVKKGQAALHTGPRALSGGLMSRLLPKRLLRGLIVKVAPKLGYL